MQGSVLKKMKMKYFTEANKGESVIDIIYLKRERVRKAFKQKNAILLYNTLVFYSPTYITYLCIYTKHIIYICII